ncbi:hypothetical protein ACH5RR_032081 [Cinchona calisaya]|uniref:Uncharacterized protein n=1 Tax=Cinchona calisaya TaxID=153742 RepID=A0ABD2YH21_9GENT
MWSFSPDDNKPSRSNMYGSFSKEENPESQFLEISTPNGKCSPDDPWLKNKTTKKKKKNQVFLEGYVETSDEDELGRTKSLTDDDLEELKGCLDLGFGFSYDEIPELCNTLPALELCYSMSQKYLDEQQKTPPESLSDTASSSSVSSPIASWKISSPGDDPEDVKARLKYWAQAVACTRRIIELLAHRFDPSFFTWGQSIQESVHERSATFEE